VASTIVTTGNKEKELIIKKALNQLVKQARQLNIEKNQLVKLFKEALNEWGGEV